MDRRDRPRKASSAAASMAALAAAAAAGEGADGVTTHADEYVKPNFLGGGGAGVAAGDGSPSSLLASPTAAVPVSARRGGGGGGPSCQAERCGADLTEARRYHRRHKVCEAHARAPVVIVAGLRQRFCQQCSRFHELSEFDDIKKSCRKRLAGHNERRRKSSADPHNNGGGGGGGGNGWRHDDQDGRSHPGNPQLNNLHIG